jgi:hypothetical protein
MGYIGKSSQAMARLNIFEYNRVNATDFRDSDDPHSEP